MEPAPMTESELETNLAVVKEAVVLRVAAFRVAVVVRAVAMG